MFLLKKIIAPLFLPTTMTFILLLTGISLLWFTKKQKTGKILVTISVVLLAFFSYGIFANAILGSIENDYSPLTDLHEVVALKWVVVLGGGLTSDPAIPTNDQLSKSSLSRLVEGIRIHKQLPKSKMLLSGGAVFNPIPEAKAMADVAGLLGVDLKDLILETLSKDTADQAGEIAKIIGFDRFVLITSAAHMPRAMVLFRNKGLNPVPAPTDYWVQKRQEIHPGDFFPGAENMRKMERAVHEYLGLLWAEFSG